MATHRYHHTPQSDELIRQAYATRSIKQRNTLATQAAQLIGAENRKSVYNRAVAIGAVQQETISRRSKIWTQKESELLEKVAHLSLPMIATRLQKAGYPRRSQTAIAHRLKQVHGGIVQCRTDAGIFSATGVAYLLGVSSNAVVKWIDKGWLKARASGSAAGSHERWEINLKDLRQFIIENPMSINKAKCDLVYIVDIVAND